MNLGPVHTYPEIFVSANFFFYADTKISASTRSVYESYTTVHTYPIRIRTSQRISQQSMRITKKAEPAIILAPNSRLSCLFTWGFNTCELEERKKFLLKNTIKNVSIKRKTEKKKKKQTTKTTHLFGRTMKYCCFLKWHWITKQQRLWKIRLGVVPNQMFWHFRSLHKKMLLQLGKKGELIKSILTSKKDWFWYCDVSVYKNIRIRASTRIPDTQRIQKFPLWRAYTEISGYTERIRRTRVDARCIRIKKICGYKNLRIRVDGASENLLMTVRSFYNGVTDPRCSDRSSLSWPEFYDLFPSCCPGFVVFGKTSVSSQN